jgi:hypothetical protein
MNTFLKLSIYEIPQFRLAQLFPGVSVQASRKVERSFVTYTQSPSIYMLYQVAILRTQDTDTIPVVT